MKIQCSCYNSPHTQSYSHGTSNNEALADIPARARFPKYHILVTSTAHLNKNHNIISSVEDTNSSRFITKES